MGVKLLLPKLLILGGPIFTEPPPRLIQSSVCHVGKTRDIFNTQTTLSETCTVCSNITGINILGTELATKCNYSKINSKTTEPNRLIFHSIFTYYRLKFELAP